MLRPVRYGLVLACRWLLFGVLCILAPTVAVAQNKQGSHGKPHAARHTGHAHAKPAPHAKAKKRPTVPKKAVAKHSKPTQKAHRAALGPRVLPKPNHETLTPVRRVPPPTPVAGKQTPQSLPLEAPVAEPTPHAVPAPEAPTPPVAPEVPAPKSVAAPAASE